MLQHLIVKTNYNSKKRQDMDSLLQKSEPSVKSMIEGFDSKKLTTETSPVNSSLSTLWGRGVMGTV
jgi:hypothetical protein